MIESITIQCTQCKKETEYLTSGADVFTPAMHVECNCKDAIDCWYPFRKLFWLISEVNGYWRFADEEIELITPPGIYIPEPWTDKFSTYDTPFHIRDISFRLRSPYKETDNRVYQQVLVGKKPMREIEGAKVIPLQFDPFLLSGSGPHEASKHLGIADELTILFVESLNALNFEIAQIAGCQSGYSVRKCRLIKSLRTSQAGSKPL